MRRCSDVCCFDQVAYTHNRRHAPPEHLLRSLLWGVRPNDPLTFAIVVATLLTVAVAASVLPALRVRRLDPVSLLRSEYNGLVMW